MYTGGYCFEVKIMLNALSISEYSSPLIPPANLTQYPAWWLPYPSEKYEFVSWVYDISQYME
jgi:hypothetical protein